MNQTRIAMAMALALTALPLAACDAHDHSAEKDAAPAHSPVEHSHHHHGEAHDHHHHDAPELDLASLASGRQPLSDTLFAEHAVAKATIPGIKVSAGYLTLTNTGQETIRLVAAETALSQHTEFHRMFMRDNKMAMRKMEAIEIPAGESFAFTTGGYHLMFMGITTRFTAGETFDVVLIDDKDNRYTVQLSVKQLDKL
ncbi:copper chaperone PCu(A)C [Thaumasiovibrio subtropicus]|uniref:copper chaperone PCu(A)C n=1 Tax=Thaumasiovibrio subtropicus TaxID=1891207 RepID=UPI000B35BCEC|nr:copper chaperone PCu(A)C [Thaumasiovibrio subtropicus]